MIEVRDKYSDGTLVGSGSDGVKDKYSDGTLVGVRC